jgi:N-acetylmuramoyl-L-alanine amidase
MRFSFALVLLLAATIALGKVVIVIDPGHPSEVGPGTRGKLITEMAAAWQVAEKLRPLLEAKGYRVVLTKASMKQKVTNRARAEVANLAKADVMLRLHCDYAPGERGFGTYYADRPGRDGKFRGPTPDVLRRVKPMASAFHLAVMRSLNGALGDRGLKTDRATKVGGEHGALIGSIHSRVPSILVEMAVLNNDADDRFMASTQGQQKLAAALADGIDAALAADPSKLRKN